ncbi:uncharacterized protein LOC123806151 isoform X2 [Phyllostomus hastatus]|uniref:uncharacterized protein LOC123806151 isoform X2 n=1 Tax=Phyllostomus hastatus TaxID=9423 RepID=UPI001E6842AE|nr:uncharacterized protein LOC123806151 isoform X2 [Phyllostomus hastatus]
MSDPPGAEAALCSPASLDASRLLVCGTACPLSPPTGTTMPSEDSLRQCGRSPQLRARGTANAAPELRSPNGPARLRPFCRPSGRIRFLAPAASGGCWSSLACGPFQHRPLLPFHDGRLPHLWSPRLPPVRSVRMRLSPPGHPGDSPSQEPSPHHPCKSFCLVWQPSHGFRGGGCGIFGRPLLRLHSCRQK